MTPINRRRFLKAIGGTATATGGIAAILASGRAPAYAQTTTVHWLHWNDFVPAADEARRAMLPEAERALGIKVNLERVKSERPAAAQYGFHVQHAHVIPSYSKNQKAAEDLLRWFHTAANYDKWFRNGKSFYSGATTEWENNPMWNEDPVMRPYKVAGRLGQVPGYPGPTGPKPAESLSKYLIVNMFGRVAQGKMSAEESVKVAEGDLKRIYG